MMRKKTRHSLKRKKIRHVGFTHIFTSDHPPSRFSPKKSPYIIFIMPYKIESDKEFVKRLDELGLSFLGLTKLENDKVSLTITSARKVIRAIDIFSSLPEYKTDKKKLSSLNKYKRKCEKIQEAKGSKPIPSKGKRISQFKRIKNSSLPKTSHVIYRMTKKTLKNKKEYIHKANVTGRTISEIETFNGFCYRVLLGERHPKVKGTYGEQGERKGVASEILPEFTSIHEYVQKNGKLTKNKLLDSEIIKIWVAAYTEEETDLHLNNYGFDKTNFCVKIDDDRSTWPLTSKYANVDSELGDPKGPYKTPPVSAFKVTQRDISSFPKLKDANPYHWCDRQGNEQAFDVNALNEVMKEKKFIEDKWYMFLKRILIPREVYEAIGLATIGSVKTRKKICGP